MKTLEVLDHVLKGKKVKLNTRKKYVNTFEHFARFSENWPERAVVIDEYLNSLPNLSDTTMLIHFKFLKSAAKYMCDNYDLPDPTLKAHRPKLENKRRRYFTPEEMLTIIKSSAENQEDKTLILMLIDSSCRIGEVSGLDVAHVGLNYIDVRGKTGERRYRCNPGVCDDLRRFGAGRPAIFLNQYGKPASPDNLQARVTRIIKHAGIKGKKLGAHTFRHSAASLIAQSTGSALMVKSVLQQDDIDSSMGYIHDAEDGLAQGISPLQLMNDKLGIKNKLDEPQLALTSPDMLPEPVVEKIDPGIIDLLELEYNEIPEGLSIRPMLNSLDLQLIRRAFIGYTKIRLSEEDNMKLKNLFKRIMRKVK